ncbi:hypothetical protein [Streptomyces sp. NPDC058268]|uniref:hypothetical protein n=1 Tax=Streptomyces sp. NPDC058268 TaxID=3346413 RepID=UPI0036E608D4
MIPSNMKGLSVRGTIPLMFVVLSIVATVACGSSASSEEPLSAAMLRDALPDVDDLPGFRAKAQSVPVLERQDVVTTDEAACRPIADMMNVRPKHPREAMVWATLDGKDMPDRGSLLLSSFAHDEASVWMSELKAARTDCTEFTATSKRGWAFQFTVKPLPPVSAGDDSVAYVLTNTRAPGGKGNSITVVRSGGVLATYLLEGQSRAMPGSAAGKQHAILRHTSE